MHNNGIKPLFKIYVETLSHTKLIKNMIMNYDFFMNIKHHYYIEYIFFQLGF